MDVEKKLREELESFSSKYGLPDKFNIEEQIEFAKGAVAGIDPKEVYDAMPVWLARKKINNHKNIILKVHGIFIVTKKWMFVTYLKKNWISIVNRKQFLYEKWLVKDFRKAEVKIEKSFGRARLFLFMKRDIKFSFSPKAFSYVNEKLQKYALKNEDLFLMRDRADELGIEVHKTMSIEEIKNLIDKKERNRELRLDHEAGSLQADLYQKGANIDLTKAKAERLRKDGPLLSGGTNINLNNGGNLLGLNEETTKKIKGIFEGENTSSIEEKKSANKEEIEKPKNKLDDLLNPKEEAPRKEKLGDLNKKNK